MAKAQLPCLEELHMVRECAVDGSCTWYASVRLTVSERMPVLACCALRRRRRMECEVWLVRGDEVRCVTAHANAADRESVRGEPDGDDVSDRSARGAAEGRRRSESVGEHDQVPAGAGSPPAVCGRVRW